MKSLLPRLYLLVTFLVSFGWLLPGVAGHITAGDAAELALAGSTLGIAHAPGYPTFVVLAHFTDTLLPFGNAAYQQNMVSCLLMSASLVMFGLLVVELTGLRWVAFLPLLLLFSPLFRHGAYVTEVFPLLFLWAATMAYFLFHFHRRRHNMFLLAFLFGLGLGVHLTLVFLLPGFVFYFMKSRRQTMLRLSRDFPLMILFFLIGMSVFLFLPIRSFQNPLLDWEDPQTWERIYGMLTRARYGFLQLAQGTQENFWSFRSLVNALRYWKEATLNNIGWIGIGLMVLGTLASLARRNHRRMMISCWLFLIFTGPFFLWMAKAAPNDASDTLARFGLLPLVPTAVLMMLCLATLWASRLWLYRGFMALLIVGLVVELSSRHPLSLSAQPIGGITEGVRQTPGSLRWDLSIREAGVNMLSMIPKEAVLLADRADESEFSLAFLINKEKRKPGVRFIDCNAGVTKSIYGDDYYRIWGRPRLERRQLIEKRILSESKSPVFYATVNPNMIDIYRGPWGLLFRAYRFESIQDPTDFPWGKIIQWRFVPQETRSRNIYLTNYDLLGRAFFDGKLYEAAARTFGLGQTLGASHRLEKMGYWYQTRGFAREARQTYEQAIAAGVRSPLLYANLGMMNAEEGRFSAAVEVYEQGLEKFPRSIDLLYNLSVAKWNLGEWSDVIALLNKIQTIDPKNAQAARLLPTAEAKLQRSRN